MRHVPATDAAAATEDLPEAARRAYADGDLEGAVGAWETLHRRCLDAGDAAGAAEAAAMVAVYLLIDTGLMAPVRGWVRRAEHLLEPETDTAVHALLSAVRGYERFMCGDLEAATIHSDRAIALGERHGVADATVIGETARARLTLLRGDLATGLELLEEVGARLMAGDATPLATGMMLCEVICAAQGLSMHDLAREWTEVMERWRHDAASGGFHGRCRVHRAELLRLSGPLDEAEREALGACEDLRPWMRREYGWPLVELGNVRLRRGDLAGAETAFTEALARAWCPQPGLALVHLARGDLDGAAVLLDEAIAHPLAIPSKEQPPSGDLRNAPLLHARAQVAAAAGDAPAAVAAAAALDQVASSFPSPALHAMACVSRARALLLDGRAREAEGHAREAIGLWAELDAPYECASARLVAADALDVLGRVDAADRERSLAARACEEIGAAGLCEPLRDADSAVFTARDGLRRVVYGGMEATVPDLKGLRYLARLLAEPGGELHVLDLVALESPEDLGTGAHRGLGHGPPADRWQEGLPVIDEQAKQAYRRRLREVEEDLEEARADHDLARVELAERDRDYLLAELSGAFGLGGRARVTGSSAERARTAVTRSLRYSLTRLEKAHPLAAAHLSRAVRTGSFCSYAPDPTRPVAWTVD